MLQQNLSKLLYKKIELTLWEYLSSLLLNFSSFLSLRFSLSFSRSTSSLFSSFLVCLSLLSSLLLSFSALSLGALENEKINYFSPERIWAKTAYVALSPELLCEEFFTLVLESSEDCLLDFFSDFSLPSLDDSALSINRRKILNNH